MTDFDPAIFATADPSELARTIKSTPDARLKEIMRGPARRPVLDQIFARFPTLFRPERAGGTEAVIHWNVTDGPDGGVDTYEVVVANAVCTTSGEPSREPRLALTLSPLDFLKLIAGANPVMMFMTGKLKAKGDLSLAADIAKLFDLPKG